VQRGTRQKPAAWLKQNDRPKLRLFYGLITAGMALLTVARNTMLFMVGWEIIAAAAFLTPSASSTERSNVTPLGFRQTSSSSSHAKRTKL
jgi:formate hydrogenlyase subunit 3/multisubunit Na+/H+ antiporter MnhD subunit